MNFYERVAKLIEGYSAERIRDFTPATDHQIKQGQQRRSKAGGSKKPPSSSDKPSDGGDDKEKQ